MEQCLGVEISILGIKLKLQEECQEVVAELMEYSKNKTLSNLKKIVSETFDLIQVCILILWRAHRKSLDLDENNLIKDMNIKHNDKLISKRGWIPETGIEIEIKE